MASAPTTPWKLLSIITLADYQNLYLPTNSADEAIWLTISIPLFIAPWFLQYGKGGFSDHSGPYQPLGLIWGVFITGCVQHYTPFNTSFLIAILQILGMLTLIFAVLAALLGWIFQFFVCMAWDYLFVTKTAYDSHSI